MAEIEMELSILYEWSTVFSQTDAIMYICIAAPYRLQ